MTPSLLSLEGISKRFGATLAVDDVDLDFPAGSVQAIIGHNGAGKSTLMKVLNGEVAPDSGSISIEGRRVEIKGPAEAARLGIGVVHQETLLCSHLTVLENMFVGREVSNGGLLSWRAMRAEAAELLAVLGLGHLRDVPAGRLDVAHQQLTDIARALLTNPQILILDEPNSALGERESEELFARVRALRDRGHLVLYVSHRLREVRDIADSIAVMRDGRVVERVGPSTSVDELAALLLGAEPVEARPDEAGGGLAVAAGGVAAGSEGEPVLSVADWSDRRGTFADVSLQVRGGEIVGLCGIEGAGHRELLRSLGGLRRARGRLAVAGAPTRRPDIGRLMAAGVVYLSPDRGAKSLFQRLSVERNIGASVPDRWSTAGWQRRGRLRELAADQISAYGIRARPTQPVSALSGGNQQKVALARLIATEPRAVLLEEPTRGVDLGAKAEIYGVLRELQDAGAAVVVTSPELDELVELCDRVLVLADGGIRAELSGASLSEKGLLAAAAA